LLEQWQDCGGAKPPVGAGAELPEPSPAASTGEQALT
jgi:hypothetical protein